METPTGYPAERPALGKNHPLAVLPLWSRLPWPMGPSQRKWAGWLPVVSSRTIYPIITPLPCDNDLTDHCPTMAGHGHKCLSEHRHKNEIVPTAVRLSYGRLMIPQGYITLSVVILSPDNFRLPPALLLSIVNLVSRLSSLAPSSQTA